MPNRVKCLHVLVAHALAAGPGVNPLGDEALAAAARTGGRPGPCVRRSATGATRRDAGSPRSTAAPTRSGCWSPTSGRADDGRCLDRARRRDAHRPARPGRRPHRRLAPEAIERTRAALAEYAAAIADTGAERVRMVATSALARRGQPRRLRARWSGQVLGIDPEVVTGGEEAELSFPGATAGPAGVRRRARAWSSTSVAVRPSWCAAAPAAARCRAHSMDVGCVRLTERHLHDDPPTAAQVAAAEADVAAALDWRRSGGPARWNDQLRRRRRHCHDRRRAGAGAAELRPGRHPRIEAERRAGARRRRPAAGA